MAAEKKLSEQKIRFCEYYLGECNFNATQAAIMAGYSEKTAAEQASRLLSSVNVQNYLSERRKSIIQDTDSRLKSIVDLMEAIVKVDPIEFFDDNGNVKALKKMSKAARVAIAGIKTMKMGVGTSIMDIKLTAKPQLFDMLMKHLGGYEKDNSQQGKGAANPFEGMELDDLLKLRQQAG